jgi:hypothetical protein
MSFVFFEHRVLTSGFKS